MPYDDIRKALLRCDEAILTENITEQLIQVSFTCFDLYWACLALEH